MKLIFVKLSALTVMPKGTTDELRPEIHGDLVYLPDQHVIKVGDRLIPITSVRTMTLDTQQVICPECAEGFADARAVGAHRSHVHDVPGKSNKKFKEKK